MQLRGATASPRRDAHSGWLASQERSERQLQRQQRSSEAAWAKAGDDESSAYAAQLQALSRRLEAALAGREELRGQMQARLDQQEG